MYVYVCVCVQARGVGGACKRSRIGRAWRAGRPPLFEPPPAAVAATATSTVAVHTTPAPVISPDFSHNLTGFFQGSTYPFLVLKMKDFWIFVLHICILVFDAEQVCLKLQVTNLENKEVTVKPKPQTLGNIGFSRTMIP